MDRFDAMSVFLAVVEAGSLSAASRKLNAPLPTVSRKISELEAHLNTRLLLRSTRKLALTEAGAAFAASARQILDEVSAAERAAAGEYSAPRGELCVGAPALFGRLHVLPVITDFLAQYPEISVRLVLSDRNALLIDDHIDLAVRIGPLQDSQMVATRVGQMRQIVCGSPAFLASHGEPEEPGALSRLPCVTFDFLVAEEAWHFTRPGGGEIVVPIRPRLRVNAADAAVEASACGVGVTRVLGYQAARALAEGRLRVVLAAYEPPLVPVSLLHAGQGLMPLKLRVFLDFAAARLRARLAEAGGVQAGTV